MTPAACLATAFAEAIGSFTTESRFLLNVPLFHRQQILPDIDRVVGDFSSSVLVTVDVSQEQTVLDRIRAVSESMHGSMRHSDWSALDILRDMSRSRGSQVIAPIVYTSAVGLGELFSARVRSVFGDPVWILSEGPQVLLDAQVTELMVVSWPTGMSAKECSFRGWWTPCLRRTAPMLICWCRTRNGHQHHSPVPFRKSRIRLGAIRKPQPHSLRTPCYTDVSSTLLTRILTARPCCGVRTVCVPMLSCGMMRCASRRRYANTE